MTDSLHFLKTQSIPKIVASLLLSGVLSSALAGPWIEWVSPPAWLETSAGNEPAQPGRAITGQAWITTGRAGKVLVRIDHEQVELDQNSMWEWQGLNNGSTGNALQGAVRVGTAAARATPTDSGADETAIRLYFNAQWTLVLDVGDDAINAQRLLLYLRRSGYPMKAESLAQAKGGAAWQLLMEGFMSTEAALRMGGQIMGLAPGIVSATYRRSTNQALGGETGTLQFSNSLDDKPKP